MRALIGLLVFSLGLVVGPAKASEPNVQTVDGITVYLGVMPAEIIRGHAAQHPEARMHGGPGGSSDRHVLIALFDSKTFARIVDADVTATVEGLGHMGRTQKKLERMDIAGAVTFGAYFPFQGIDKYTIRVEINAHDPTRRAVVTFSYEL